MALVTVKPKFQVTIPAKLRKDIDLREGDIMQLLSAMASCLSLKTWWTEVAAADRIAAKFAEAQPTPVGSGAV